MSVSQPYQKHVGVEREKRKVAMSWHVKNKPAMKERNHQKNKSIERTQM